MHARFVRPVYDGDAVVVSPDLELRDSGGELCAVATAGRSHEVAVEASAWPGVAPAVDPPPAAPETLVPGTVFALAPHTFHADVHAEYLDAVRESLPIYRDEGIAHPAWILRDANYVLSANVRLGPWIHVQSDVAHFGVVPDGSVVSARALVVDELERGGHRFVTLDVVHLADDRPVARTTHTAIYRPRGI
jgi:hypothetical protein